MKKVAGTLKIDQAQYRELESFSKFSSDMDAVTAMTLDRGRKTTNCLYSHSTVQCLLVSKLQFSIAEHMA